MQRRAGVIASFKRKQHNTGFSWPKIGTQGGGILAMSTTQNEQQSPTTQPQQCDQDSQLGEIGQQPSL
jgi:hypothetical protein